MVYKHMLCLEFQHCHNKQQCNYKQHENCCIIAHFETHLLPTKSESVVYVQESSMSRRSASGAASRNSLRPSSLEVANHPSSKVLCMIEFDMTSVFKQNSDLHHKQANLCLQASHAYFS